jgi:hypothetical protein
MQREKLEIFMTIRKAQISSHDNIFGSYCNGGARCAAGALLLA